jgi:hypothetical protein
MHQIAADKLLDVRTPVFFIKPVTESIPGVEYVDDAGCFPEILLISR